MLLNKKKMLEIINPEVLNEQPRQEDQQVPVQPDVAIEPAQGNGDA